VTTKEQGNPTTNFKTQEYDLRDEKSLIFLFKNHVYSVNSWNGIRANSQEFAQGFRGKRAGDNYVGMWGVILDVDNDNAEKVYSLKQAQEDFKDYKHIIMASTSNNIDKPGYGIKQRFHILLPFGIIKDEPLYPTIHDADAVYDFLKEKYKYIPGAGGCFDTGRQIFPFGTDENDISNYFCIINSDGEWFSIDQVEIDKRKPGGTIKKKSKMPRSKDVFISKNDVITLKDGKKSQIKDLPLKPEGKTIPCFCNNCNDELSKSMSGFIGMNLFGEYFMGCSHCSKTFWEQTPRYNPKDAEFHYHGSKGAIFLHPEGEFKEHSYIKNDKDWINYCTTNKINPRIFARLPRTEIIVDIALPAGYIKNKEIFNLFIEPELLRKKHKMVSFEELKILCPIHYSILTNVFLEDVAIKRFLNWAAYILICRKKPQQAWIISSELHGTGKNRVVENILGPFFGKAKKQWAVTPGKHLNKSNFNKEDITLWLQAYNEVYEVGNLKKNIRIQSDLNSMITDDQRRAEFKNVDALYVSNITNYIFMSNHATALIVAKEDRRYSVVHANKSDNLPLNEMSWWRGFDKMVMDLANERKAFAGYLLNITPDEEKANNPMMSKSREVLIENSQSDMDMILGYLEAGDVDAFEIDEVFPISSDSIYNNISLDSNSLKNTFCKEAIGKKWLPAKYLVEIMTFHWKRGATRMQILKQLKIKGYESDSRKFDDGKSYKVWFK
jgi:hypothetical protein